MAEYIEPTEDELDNMSDTEMDQAFADAKAAQSGEVIVDPVEEVEVPPEQTDDLEQPTETLDSDDDVTDEELTKDMDDEDSNDDEPTGEADDEKIEDEIEIVKEPEVKVEPRRFKARANGQDVEFTQEEVNNLFPNMYAKAADYTKKMQALKPQRGRIDAMESAGITDEQFSLMMDVLKGDKAALDEVIERANVNVDELGTGESGEYQPTSYGRDDRQLAIDDVVGSIEKDPEYAVTSKVISEQWDDNSKSMLADNPNMISLLHTDVKSGMYDMVAPLAEKRKMSDMISGRAQKSDLEYYREVGGEYYNMLRQQEASNAHIKILETANAAKQIKLEEVKAATAKRAATKASAAKRKAAATNGNASRKPVTDYLDDDDESYDAWYKALQDKM